MVEDVLPNNSSLQFFDIVGHAKTAIDARLSTPERYVKCDQTIFSSLGADPLVKSILVMAQQSTIRRLSHMNSSFSKLLLFNSSSSNFGSSSTPEIDSIPVEDKTIFLSSQAAPCSKVILVKFEPSIRRYLRHLKSSSSKMSMFSVHEMCRSLTHCNLGSLARTFRSSWFSGVPLRVTLASLLLPPLVNNGKRCLAPLMLRLSSFSGWCFR